MNIYMSGSGYGTGPGQTLWFCHICQWSGALKAGEWHQCKPKDPKR